MYIRRNSAIKYCVAVLFGAVLYSEKFVYLMQSMYWQDLNCLSHDETCTKILFIADPQIQGDLAVPWPLNLLFNWDSDRYLKMTFSKVIDHFKPDVLVYLGDLMDEGSISTNQQFYAYVKRLADIFEVPYQVVQIWIPGDNDIGGENESIKQNKLSAFQSVFDQPSVVLFRNITFHKVNAITHQFTYVVDDVKPDNSLKIVVSHYPLLIRRAFVGKVNSYVHPNIYFCAHDHESKYMVQNKHSEKFLQPVPFYDSRILTIPLDVEDRYEIYVPTCSYRMGTSNIGYGAGVLDLNNQQMRYTVFWSSQRFPYLFFYLFVLSLLIVFGMGCCVLKVCCIYCQRYDTRGKQLPLYSKL